MDPLEIETCGTLRARVRPPGSKSITNRALICAALADGTSTLYGTLDSEDTQVMIKGLQQLGIGIERESPTKLLVRGGSVDQNSADIFVANSGTTVRFLAAMLSTIPGRFRLDGVERMRERPISDLLEALGTLGVSAISEMETGAPPVVVSGDGLPGGTTTVSGTISSQYLSGLLMAAPNALNDVTIRIDGELVSRPYIQMTLDVMRSFGVEIDVEGNVANSDANRSGGAADNEAANNKSTNDEELKFSVAAPQSYQARNFAVEPDASAASYFWAAAAICGGSVVVKDLTSRSIQGDVRFCECLREMGCQVTEMENGIQVAREPDAILRGVDVDMNDISDTVQTIGAVALFADSPTRVRGVAHIRHKETDRIGDLARELRKLGADVDEHEDGLTIYPGEVRGAEIDTYRDHRMAMSLSLVGLRVPGVKIRDPGCVDKTYPEFFRDLESIKG